MFYREWLSLRSKVLIWLIIFGGWAILFLYQHIWLTPWVTRPYYEDQTGRLVYQSLFNEWLSGLATITPLVALLSAVDLFSEETGKGTHGFMLVQPLSRARIYATKLLLTAGVLVIVLGLTSTLVLAGDRVPKPVYFTQFTLTPCQPFDACLVPGMSESMNLPVALISFLLIALCGTVVLFGTGLLSIYCRSILLTGIAALPVLFLTYALLYLGGRVAAYQNGTLLGVATGQIFTPSAIVADLNLLMWWTGVLLASCLIVFGAGIVAFKRLNL